MDVPPFVIGILWATSSKSGDRWRLRNEDRFFAEQLQDVQGGAIWKLKHNRKGTPLFCVNVKPCIQKSLLSLGFTGRSDQSRTFPQTEDNVEFARGYIQVHGNLDIVAAKSRCGESIQRPRIRLNGSPDFLQGLNILFSETFGFSIKSVQLHQNEKMGILYFQSAEEVKKLCNWIKSGAYTERFFRNIN